ncbi:MAG: MFS transporter [Enterococcus sp.]|nr:MFS transporter [Enterococcus sp.]
MDRTSKKIFFLLVVASGSFLALLNLTFLDPAYPVIMEQYNIDSATVQLLDSGFNMVNAIMVPIAAFLLDKYTAKKILISSMVIFLVGSSISLNAPGFYVVLCGRLVQGISSGILMPVGTTLFLWSFPPEKRGLAMGLWGVCLGAGPMLGPLVSSIIVDNFKWQAVFQIDIIFGIIIVICMFFIHNIEGVEDSKTKLHVPSLVLSILGLGSLLYGLSMIGSKGIDILSIVLLLAGAALTFVFCKIQLKLETPMLKIAILKNKNFLVGCIVVMIVHASILATATLVPIYIQTIMDQSAVTFALVMLPASGLAAVLNPVGGILMDKTGIKKVSIIGSIVLVLASLYFCFLSRQTILVVFSIIMVFRMSGISFVNMPISAWSFNALDDSVLNHGTAINNVFRTTFVALSTAIVMGIENLVGSYCESSLSMATNDAYLVGINCSFAFCSILALVSLILVIKFVKD